MELRTECKLGILAVKLVGEAFFGDEKCCTPRGWNDLPALSHVGHTLSSVSMVLDLPQKVRVYVSPSLAVQKPYNLGNLNVRNCRSLWSLGGGDAPLKISRDLHIYAKIICKILNCDAGSLLHMNHWLLLRESAYVS